MDGSKAKLLDVEIDELLREWRVNRPYYWRSSEYNREIVERALVILLHKWQYKLCCSTGLKAAAEHHVILKDAAREIRGALELLEPKLG